MPTKFWPIRLQPVIRISITPSRRKTTHFNPRIHRCYLRQRRPIQIPSHRDAFQSLFVLPEACRRQWHICRVRGRQREPHSFQSESQLESGWFEFAACD